MVSAVEVLEVTDVLLQVDLAVSVLVDVLHRLLRGKVSLAGEDVTLVTVVAGGVRGAGGGRGGPAPHLHHHILHVVELLWVQEGRELVPRGDPVGVPVGRLEAPLVPRQH